ncbi:hypothetical protein NA57DRAFT_60541 [Rhizodiscina lignyota]|uniref:Uncharacterized protein n=1 Tax=Rhizodiscina lignyota TaxID=1504668 RepID=A0A9P4I888_9PEZI|nr:hypothetical protein NA57DRAFT_60541 [Rhizodiscina lignyota]
MLAYMIDNTVETKMDTFLALLLFSLLLLVTEPTSDILTNTLGILVTIACSRLFRMGLRGLEILGLFLEDARDPESFAWRNIRAGLDTMSPYESSVQAESATLAESCLNADSPDCGSFIDPALSITVENSTCPFDAHLCYGNGVSPIRISTGAVSARKIGINSPGLLEFNRTTVCSPVNMNRTYVNLVSQQGNKWTFGYYYGRSYGWPTTSYETIRRGDRGDLPNYEVAPLWSDGSPSNPWLPIRELTPEFGSSTTLVIIVSQKINYLERRSDPIFPAEDNTTFSGDPRIYYINLSGPGTVLACVDKSEWRYPAVNELWFLLGQLPTKEMHDSRNGKALYLLINSLIGSTIYSSFNLRLASALNAQSRITGFVSLPLAKEQWKTEVQQLFNASLARIMINARDIARGAKSEYYGFKKAPRVEIDICDGTYLMKTSGWKNINFTGMMWVLCTSVLVMLLAIPFTVQINSRDVDVLPIEYVCKWPWNFAKWLGKLAKEVGHFISRIWESRPQFPSWQAIKQTISRIFTC